MQSFDINEGYFAWLCSCINTSKKDGYDTKDYGYLLGLLHSIPFEYSLELDYNRFVDGVDLRARYIREDLLPSAFKSHLDGPCSVLEMMVALALRCEETIMTDTRFSNRTGKWFWIMVNNMALTGMTDRYFNEGTVREAVDIMMSRRYCSDGSKGGMFVVRKAPRDLRKTDIWYQLMWYLNESETDNSNWLA